MDSHRNTTTSRQPSQHQRSRRPPAHQSVSLRHNHPISRTSTAPTSDQANPSSTVSPKLTTNKQSSGESSDAGNWYEKTNNNAAQSSASFMDNDPPFFLRNSSSSDSPPEGHGLRSAYIVPQSATIPHRPGLVRRDTDGSSAQDFRSVIDDLTVANKKLKQKLRKYEKLYDAHLQDEKLFEVRFHGLPDHKKRELEEHLRKFAADLDSTSNTVNPLVSYAPPLVPHKSTHSHTSRIAESGYASMSASGQNSTSAALGQNKDRRRVSKSQYNEQQQSIHSYLHDIPAGLLPKRNTPMTEKSKKKLVVRRLEQIFAGKRSAPGSHPQPMQQEEVAQSAAMADRRAKEATGQRSKLEGLREARIMPSQSEDDENNITAPAPGILSKLPPNIFVNDQELVGSGSPDQRPTRPLDLDPYRAQVPAENIQYIRHLGFTPPNMVSGEAPREGHGWLYLNLLINMAQLHTINVTPDFVKEAVSEFSSKFELSPDGRKIRWRGDQDVAAGSSDSSSEQLGNSPYRAVAGMNSTSLTKRFNPSHCESNESILELDQQARRVAQATKRKEQGKFAYTPLFFHKDDSEDEDNFYNQDMSSSNNSPFPAHPHGDSSGIHSSGMQASPPWNRRDDGPIIFYNQAKFCTDLSGDRRSFAADVPASYNSFTTQALGEDLNIPSVKRLATDISEPRGPLEDATTDTELKEGEKTYSSEDGIGLSPESLLNDISSDENAEIMDFEASGVGGVQPDDNFAIKVRRSQVQTAPSPSARAQRHKSYHYPKKILEALKEQPLLEGELPRKQPNVIREEVLSASKKSLPSSALPPASFLPFDSLSECDEGSGSDSDVSSDPSPSETEDETPDPVTNLQLLNIAAPTSIGPTYAIAGANKGPVASSSENSSLDGSDASDDDDGSVDFLATARKLDPKTVFASEREYDATIAERLAEEIPAGSSAATAGGGSGFNTPHEGMAVIQEDVENVDLNVEMCNLSQSAEGRPRSLKRSRTSESIAASLQKQKLQKKDQRGR